MELVVMRTLPMAVAGAAAFSNSIGGSKLHRQWSDNSWYGVEMKKSGTRERNLTMVSSTLAETAVSVAVASIAVGVAATVLVKRTQAEAAAKEIPMRVCDDCQGSGICSECKGEGFVLKRLSEKSAEKARLTAQNAATRYTAGLPKKWSYCSRCSSARSCISRGGQGKVSL